jgi:ribosomal protein S4
MPDLEFTSEERSEGMSFKPVVAGSKVTDWSSEFFQLLESRLDYTVRRDLN